jgi:hypothetical protein
LEQALDPQGGVPTTSVIRVSLQPLQANKKHHQLQVAAARRATQMRERFVICALNRKPMKRKTLQSPVAQQRYRLVY